MSRRSLQIDNKKNAQRKSSFFDAEFDTAGEYESVAEQTDNLTSSVACEKKNKRFRTVACVAVLVLVAMLVTAVAISGIEFFIGKLDENSGTSSTPNKYNICAPDWETNIFELKEYQELLPGNITYKKGNVETFYEESELEKDGMPNKAVAFFYEYFNAIKKADTETLNSFFTDEYISENGRFLKKIPMQKIYNIEIEEHSTNAELEQKYKNKDYGIYLVSYNIYRNDGLFCAEVDETYARVEGVVVVFDGNGNGKISEKIDASYYS